MLDNARRSVPHDCLKCFSYRNGLREPASPTVLPCGFCNKKAAYDDWNLWCITCDILACNVCVNHGRVGHRHAMVWFKAVRKDLNFQNNNIFNMQRSCDRCKQNYMSALFQGLECTVCRNYHTCLQCTNKKKMPQHLKCRGRDSAWEWQLIKD